MMRAFELVAFGMVATGLHVVAVVQLSDALPGGAAPAASGSVETVMLAPADTNLRDLVADWETPPAVADAAQPVAPDATAPPRPDLARKLPDVQADAPRIAALEPVDARSRSSRQPDRAAEVAPLARPEDLRRARVEPAAATPGSAGRSAAPAAQAAPAGNDAGLEAAHAAAVRGALAQARRYPDRARDRGIVGRPVLALELDRSGRLLGVALRRSSGSDILDRASLEAAQRARFPVAPPALAGQRFSYEVGVVYALD